MGGPRKTDENTVKFGDKRTEESTICICMLKQYMDPYILRCVP